MSNICLIRIDPAHRISRYYYLELRSTLFGGSAVVREWGRIGRQGRLRIDSYPTEAAGRRALEKFAAAKRQRGYGAIGTTVAASASSKSGR